MNINPDIITWVAGGGLASTLAWVGVRAWRALAASSSKGMEVRTEFKKTNKDGKVFKASVVLTHGLSKSK
jgi:hypothetical protein